MIFNHIKVGCLILLFSLPFMMYGLKLNADRVMLLSKGSYFFEKTRNSADIVSIVLKFDNNKNITINKQNELWHIKEADDYFVSFAKINTLVSLIRNTIIYRADAIKKSDTTLIENTKKIAIQSLDKNGKVIDEAFVFEKLPNNKNHYALLNNDNFLYQINGDFNISSNPMEWIQMPILKITNKEIKEIKCDKFMVNREFADSVFVDIKTDKIVNNVDSFINALWYLSAKNVFHLVNFNPNEYEKLRHYEIKLYNGIIYNTIFYRKNNSYVVKVELNRDLIMSNDGAKWLKENGVLYNDWFFEIPEDRGELLATFSI